MGYIESEIHKHDYDRGSAIDLDVAYEEVESHCRDLLIQDGQMDRWGWLSNIIRESTYAGILYQEYRCGAVHRFIVKRHWRDSTGRSQHPYYMPYEYMGQEVGTKDKWEIGDGDVDLVFPELFLIEEVERVLRRVLHEEIKSETAQIVPSN